MDGYDGFRYIFAKYYAYFLSVLAYLYNAQLHMCKVKLLHVFTVRHIFTSFQKKDFAYF